MGPFVASMHCPVLMIAVQGCGPLEPLENQPVALTPRLRTKTAANIRNATFLVVFIA
jgi:hypothetical protein